MIKNLKPGKTRRPSHCGRFAFLKADSFSDSAKPLSHAVLYDRGSVEADYGLEDGELDGLPIREAEELLGLEDGELDSYEYDFRRLLIDAKGGDMQ